MAQQKISGVALGSVFVGSVFLYAGIKGKSIPAAFQSIVQGKSPRNAPTIAPISQVEQNTQSSPPGGTPPASPAPSSTTPAVSGGTFTQDQVKQLWIAKGGDPNAAQNASCHAMQESGGRSWVTSSNPDGGTNVGLFQLDTRGVGSGYSVAQLQNPDFNTQLTIMATANGTDWSQWSTPGC